MLKVIQLEIFRKEIREFPLETREDLFSLIVRFSNGELMTGTRFMNFALKTNMETGG